MQQLVATMALVPMHQHLVAQILSHVTTMLLQQWMMALAYSLVVLILTLVTMMLRLVAMMHHVYSLVVLI
jgi:hypothetical protein